MIGFSIKLIDGDGNWEFIVEVCVCTAKETQHLVDANE